MQLTLRITAKPETVRVLAGDPTVRAACDLAAVTFAVDSASEAFRRIASLAPSTPGLWINPVVECSPREVAAVDWLQPEARGKVLVETPEEQAANEVALAACPLMSTPSGSRIRLLRNLNLSRVKLRPNEIARASDWLPEWVIPDAVREAFSVAGLRGWETGELRRLPSRSALTGYSQLFTSTLMPPVRLDRSTPLATGELGVEGGWRQLGCLTYVAADVQGVEGDFHRTSENWFPKHLPGWVVSRRVREVCQAKGIRGWAYRPVLVSGSPLDIAHTRLWEDLLGAIEGVRQIVL